MHKKRERVPTLTFIVFQGKTIIGMVTVSNTTDAITVAREQAQLLSSDRVHLVAWKQASDIEREAALKTQQK